MATPRTTFEDLAVNYLPAFVSTFFTKAPVVAPVIIDITKEKFDPENPAHTALITTYTERFNHHRDDLMSKNNKLAGVVCGVVLLWVGNLNLTAVIGLSVLVAYLDRVTYRHGDAELAFTKSLSDLHQLYQWCKSTNPQSPFVTELKTLITPFAQPAFKSISDKVSYFFDAAAKNAMMIRSGKNFQDESLANSHPQLR